MKLQNDMECMPIESEIVYEGVDDEAIDVLQSDVDRPSQKSSIVLRLDTLSIELGAMHA